MLRIQDLEKIGEGRVAEVFAWEAGEVIKLYRDPRDRNSALAEAEATAAAFAAGVPAPECRGTAVLEGRIGVILERLSGPVLGERILSGEVAPSIDILASLHAQVHGCSGAGFTSAHERLAARIATAVPAPYARRVLDHLATLPDGECVIHGDMHPFNVMGDGDRWLVIDWDAIYSGPVAFEVARTLFLLEEAADVEGAADASIRRQAAESFLSQYIALRSVDPAEVRAWRLPVLAARLSEGIVEERTYLLDQIQIALAG